MASVPAMHVAFACVDQLGHFNPLIPFMKELHDRGHRVTVFMSDSPKYAARLAESGLEDVEAIGVPLPSMGHSAKPPLIEMLKAGGPGGLLSSPLFEVITGHYRNFAPPSVFVTDFFTSAANDAADQLGVPVIVCYPNPMGIFNHLPSPAYRSWSQRVVAMGANFAEGLGARLILAGRNHQRSLHSLPPMKEQDVWPCYTMRRPMICTWGLGYEYPSLQSPLLTFVGPTMPTTFQELSGDLAEWFEQQTLPIIYVAFGTMHSFTEGKCRSLLEALKEMTGVAVLWSLPTAQQSMLPEAGSQSAVRLEAFVPQYAVLRHRKVAAFVTHCGANSIGDSILAEKPMVCCPGKADQPCNAARVVSAGAGLLAKDGAGPDVATALRAILADLSTFQKRVQKLKYLLLSHGGAKRAADVIETIGNHGYQHMVPYGQRASWLKVGVALASCACLLLAKMRRRLQQK
jgi:UDP:flavonoid glycosyltransferase YjiC (YdhE family)